MDKILIALQCWSGDLQQAIRLAKFLADLEPKHSELADFLFVHRFDCPAPTEIVSHVSRKFNLFVYKSPFGDTGWPNGCNFLADMVIEWTMCMIEAKKVPQYKAVFLCEGDGAPVQRNWLQKMHAAWDKANEKSPIFQAGAYIPPPVEHINGNCLINADPKQLRWFCRGGWKTKQGGWDWVGWEAFKLRGVADIPGMKSLYATLSFSEDEWKDLVAKDIIWSHGDKSNDLIYWGRKNLLGQANAPRFRVEVKDK
jgi:hypothetical protein